MNQTNVASIPAPVATGVDRLLRVKEVMACTGIGESFLYELMQKNEFPRPVKIGRMSAWPASEVASFIEARKAARFH